MGSSAKWQKLKKITFIFFILLILLGAVSYIFLEDNFSIEEFRVIIKNFGIWAPIVFIVFFTVGTIFIPSTPFMLTAGILFGFKYGLLYSVIGAFLSSLFIFMISRNLGKEWADRILENKYMKKLGDYNQRLEEGAVYDLIILRILPIMPMGALSILMGISRIGKKDYVVGTIVGLIPSNIITVYAGVLMTKIL